LSENELFDRADSACAETQRLIAAKAAAFAVKGCGRSETVAPSGGDLLSIAERHVAEAQHHIAIQLVLVAKLDRHGHAKLAAKARDLLVILESSLRLARQHVARVEDEGYDRQPEGRVSGIPGRSDFRRRPARKPAGTKGGMHH
jgi:hypothetical protein